MKPGEGFAWTDLDNGAIGEVITVTKAQDGVALVRISNAHTGVVAEITLSEEGSKFVASALRQAAP